MLIDSQDELIDFAPATEEKEIYQNCKIILKTAISSCHLYLSFGLAQNYVDDPQPQAFAKLCQQLVKTFAQYEPRVKIDEIIPVGNNLINGELSVKIKVSILKR